MLFFGKKEKDYTCLSLGKSKTVCGYEIKKMPFGAYCRALKKMENLPADFMAACFPGKSWGNVIDNLLAIDESGFKELVTGLLVIAPKYLLSLVSEFSGIDETELENNADIGLDGILEIIETVFEVNRLGECRARILNLKGKLMK